MKIPNFLDGINNEFISIEGEVFQVQIKLIPYNDFPIDTLNELQIQLDQDSKASNGLDLLGIHEPVERLYKFTQCVFGGFDNQADIQENGTVCHEHFDCGHRGSCPAEGKLCKSIQVEESFLTNRECEIIGWIGKDKMDKEIADILGISINTAITHRQNIRRKLGTTTAGIAAFAIERNL